MPNLLDPKTKESLINRINNLSPQSQGLWGKMNVQQMIVHINDQIKVCNGTKPASPKGSSISRAIAKFVALYVPMKMPKNLKTFKELDQMREFATPITHFEKDKQELLALLNELSTNGKNEYIHPIFGNMSQKEMGKLTFIHLDHHLKQFGV
jgi:hypothetical protein